MSRLCLVTLCASLALTGAACRREKPATVVTAAPTVESFTASAFTTRPGETITLSWKTREASTVELREAARGSLGVAEDQLNGSFQVTIDADSLFVLVAKGQGGTDTRVVAITLEGEAPQLRFNAVPSRVEGGATTTLVWNAPGAANVALEADGQPVDLLGQRETGALVVSPRHDTTYTLTADGQTASAGVTVGLAILSFEVPTASVKPGDTVTLRWEATSAGAVTLTSPGRGVLHTSNTLNGSFDDVVPELPQGGTLAYQLTATQGSLTVTRELELVVGSAGRVVRFDVPAVAAAGAPVLVRWETQRAASISLEVDGVAAHLASPTELASGAWSFNAPASDFELALVMTDASGEVSRTPRQVDVVGVPTSASLTANPAQAASGDLVTMSYAAANTRRLKVTDADGQVVFSISGDSAESGSFTLTANRTTTYTLAADNLLGGSVTDTETLTVTGTPVTVNVFPPTAIQNQMVDFTTNSPTTIYGFPHEQVPVGTSADFHDISVTGKTVLTQGGNVVRVDPGFATWLWGNRQTGNLVISRCGWLAWGAPLAEACTSAALPSSSAPVDFLAPFWANLSLKTTSSVQYEVVGEAPEQKLIVQWNDMATTVAGSSITFQAQVHQTGMVSFHYLTLTGAQAGTIIGAQDHKRVLALSTSTLPAANSARYYFGPVTSAQLRLKKGATWGGFVKVGDSLSFVGGEAKVVAVDPPADLSVTEVMITPAAAADAGQYVELFNLTEAPVELTGWSLTTDAGQWPFPAGTTVPGRGTLVLGTTIDRSLNDDAGVELAWSSSFGLPLDGGVMRFGTADAGINQTWSRSADGGLGKSTELDPGPYFLNNSSTPVSITCESTATFGAASKGSPGASRGCWIYERKAIPVQFHDISATGTQLVTGAMGVAVYDVTTLVTLAPLATDPAPFPFKTRAPTMTVSINGWLYPGGVTVTAAQARSNKTFPTTATPPIGAIAPFWDYLGAIGGTSSVAWQKLAQDEDPATPLPHWIFQWTKMRTQAAINTPESLTFQAKLFEDGSIEFHYGPMTSGNTANYGLGSSATVWIENPTGANALVVSANTQAPREGTAWRFTAR